MLSVVGVDILHPVPDLLVKEDAAQLGDHALRVLAQVCIEQIGHVVTDILRIFVNLISMVLLFHGRR